MTTDLEVLVLDVSAVLDVSLAAIALGCYTHLRQFVSQNPTLKFSEIKESYDYFGQTIMRIRRVFAGSREN